MPKGHIMKSLLLIGLIYFTGSLSIDYVLENSTTVNQIKEHNAQLECYASINFRG